MIDILKKIKIPVIVLIVCAVLFFVYTTFFKGSSSSDETLQSSLEVSAVPEEEQQFLALLLKIQNITIDTKVFNDPVFVSLQDDGLAIIDQPRGRRNPFAPIGVDAGTPFATTTGKNI